MPRTKRQQDNTPLGRTQALARQLWWLFEPRPLLPGDVWADRFRQLSKGESPEHGQWSTARTPYIRTPLRAFTDTPGQHLWVLAQSFPELAMEHGCWNPLDVAAWVSAGGVDMDEAFPAPYRYPENADDIASTDLTAIPWTRRNEMLVLMGSRQWGKTNFLLNCIGMRIHQRPCGILVTQPTDQLVRRFSKKKLGPMLRDTPVLESLVRERKDAKGSNSVAAIDYVGGSIGLASANSPAGLRMDSIEFYAADEIDGYEASAGKEGDAFDLACEMTQAFYHSRKIVVTSTPLTKLGSRIEPLYLDGTQEEWALSCPHCGAFQVIRFDDRLNYDDLTYACQYCGAADGEWQWKNRPGIQLANNPEGKQRTFHLQAMYSPFKPWAEVVSQFRAAIRDKERGNIEKYKVFVNCVRGETFEEKGTEITADSEFSRNRHAYNCDVPKGVLLLTAQADVQDDRVEVEIRGWGRGLETWGVQHIVVNGTMDQTETTTALDALLNRFWTREDGVQLPIVRMVIDSGGHYTQEVYRYTRRFKESMRVIAIKGSKNPDDPIADKASYTGIHKTPLFMIGVNQAKDQVFHRLQVEHFGPGFCHWPVETLMGDGETPRGYTEDYFTQLTAEHRVTRYISGRPHQVWMKKREGLRNEAWDLMVYGLAAILIYGPHMIDMAAREDDRRTGAGPGVTAGGGSRGRRQLHGGVKV